MNGISYGDECPSCGERQMPLYDRTSVATARCCQACQYIEELPPHPTTLPGPSMAPEGRLQRYVGHTHADH